MGNQKEEKQELDKKDKKPFSIHSFSKVQIAIIFACGVLLLLLSSEGLFNSGSEDKTDTSSTSQPPVNIQNNEGGQEYTDRLENKLKQILSKVKNVGQVEVMITVKSSKERVTLKDEPYESQTTKEQDSAGGSRESTNINKKEETVIVSSETGENVPYVVKEIEPEIEGILVIAEGASSSTVETEIVEAVMVLFDVPAHKIKVVSMK